MGIFRRGREGLPSGDAIPFFHDGTYHLFFLASPKGTDYFPERLRSGWHHVVSKDLLSWEELPMALEPPEEKAVDSDGCWTGSVLYAEGMFHIFYTGFCVDAEYPQTICHATSSDCINWTKDPGNPILVPDTEQYEKGDWRDPFVFFNEEEQIYWMILSARKNCGPAGRRGCIVLYKSRNLMEFEHCGIIYGPGSTFCPECPELYRMGEYWYLSFARFSERSKTTYCYSKSPYGSWRMPEYDGIDGRRFYAAKSLADAQGRRFYFGWIYERLNHSDQGEWQWGGDFGIPHEVSPDGKGNLKVCLPNEILRQYTVDVPSDFRCVSGESVINDRTVELMAVGSSAYGFFDIARQEVLFTCEMEVKECGDYSGISLYTDDALSVGYQLVFDFHMQRVFLNKLPVPQDVFWEKNQPAPEVDAPRVCEKKLSFDQNSKMKVQILFSENMFEIFVADTIAFSYRTYSEAVHMVGLFAWDSRVEWSNIGFRREKD